MNAIRKKRIEKGITQDELARFLAVTRTAVTKWESGVSVPRGMVLVKLAMYFECTVDELLFERIEQYGKSRLP